MIAIAFFPIAALVHAATLGTPTGADTMRICLVPTEVEGGTGNTQQVADAVRATFSSFLTGPTLAVTPLMSRLDSQARQEAKAAGCPHVLFTSVTLVHKTGGGGGSLLGKVAAGAADVGATAAASSMGNATARAATTSAGYHTSEVVRDMSSSVKAKDEMTLTYRLEAADGHTEATDKDKRTAKSDGEDLLTPAARKASEAMVTALAKTSK